MSSATVQNAKPTLGMFEFISLMALLTSLVALAIDAMLPALDKIGHDLNASSQQETHLIVSIFFMGMAVGQLLFGPYADAKGRRPTILVGLIIFALGTLVCMFAPTMEVMLLGRLIQAIGVSGPRIAAMAVIRDLFVGESMARVMSFIMMVFILVPMLAPMVGQWVLNWYSWHHIFTLFLIVTVFTGVWYFSRQPETLLPKQRVPFSWPSFFSSCRYILTHASVMGYALAMGFIFGAFLAYLSASQTIFVGFYGAGQLFPYIFATLAFSIGLASFFNGQMVMRFGMRLLCRWAIAGALCFAVVFNALLYSYNGLPDLWVTVSCLFVGFFFVGILFGNLNAMAMVPLGKMAGLGAAIIGSLASIVSVPIATFIDSFVEDNLFPIGAGFLFFFILAQLAMYVSDRAFEQEQLAQAS